MHGLLRVTSWCLLGFRSLRATAPEPLDGFLGIWGPLASSQGSRDGTPIPAVPLGFPNRGTAGVPTEGLGFVWEPREVRGVWAQGWLLSLLNPVFYTAAAGQSRGQLASFSGFVVTTPKAFPRPQVYSSPHSTEQGGFPALAALFL